MKHAKLEIVKKSYLKGHISELAGRYPAVARAIQTGCSPSEPWRSWFDTATKQISYQKLILFTGKSGYGKSTTVNALAGVNLLKTSDISACTRECQCLDFQVQGNQWLSLADLPGVGESPSRDKEYFELYERFIGQAAVVVHILRADTRDYSIDEQVSRKLFKGKPFEKKLIYALGHCDKMEPLQREFTRTPTGLQLQNIGKKLAEVQKFFSPVHPVIPYSATTRWNLESLVDAIIKIFIK